MNGIPLDVAVLEEQIRSTLDGLGSAPLAERVSAINALRKVIHDYSPFKDEPVDLVQWLESDVVQANDYNPNSVAPPEMKLLEHSIREDGYTQPIVGWRKNGYGEVEVVDGFHRTKVGQSSRAVKNRTHGYLPVVIANEDRVDRGDRIAATIRHNRARGKHRVGAMSDIVIELRRRNWSNEKVGRELGMDPDEVLRLTQISGLAEMFADREFSEAWEASLGEDPVDEGMLPDDLFGIVSE